MGYRLMKMYYQYYHYRYLDCIWCSLMMTSSQYYYYRYLDCMGYRLMMMYYQ